MCKFPPLREKRDPGRGWTKESLSFHLQASENNQRAGQGKTGALGKVFQPWNRPAVTFWLIICLRRIKNVIKVRCNLQQPYLKKYVLQLWLFVLPNPTLCILSTFPFSFRSVYPSDSSSHIKGALSTSIRNRPWQFWWSPDRRAKEQGCWRERRRPKSRSIIAHFD